MLGALLTGALAAGTVAVASPAWAATPGTDAAPGCRLVASKPTAPRGTLNGIGRREYCSSVVTYFWVRVYKAIPAWPDSETAVVGRTYVQNNELSATGPCDGQGNYYTHTSTAKGLSGDSVESARVSLC